MNLIAGRLPQEIIAAMECCGERGLEWMFLNLSQESFLV